ncbi:MAG: hypothetical protein KDD03_11545 [Gelidibacter sp.]|nr:hypothetical protein [Gelidibacter sp.]
MINKETIEASIRLIRPTAKFIAVTHSSEFITEKDYPKDKHYYYVSLHDEYIDSNYFDFDNERILVCNTYAGSFIYNLGLCFYYCFNKNQNDTQLEEQTLNLLLKYNFKKFYAEQLYNLRNCIFSRAIFLETLIYEQENMIPIFKDLNEHNHQDPLVEEITSIGTNIFSVHEMGHHFFNESDKYWNTEIAEEHKVIFQDVLGKSGNHFSSKEKLELKCDFLALISCLENTKCDETSNIAILSYHAMSLLYSLKTSSEKTIKWLNDNHSQEEVDFKNIGKQKGTYEYVVETDTAMKDRANLMIQMCEKLSVSMGLKLYEQCNRIPLSKSHIKFLYKSMQEIMQSSNANQRAICRLLAEAFHSHTEGIEYLYLRSKIFKSNRSNLTL